MAQSCWTSAPDGRYWIQVLIGNLDLQVMIDSGVIDPLHLVGFELDPHVYDRLKQMGELSHFLSRMRRNASGSLSGSESGLTTSQLICPIAQQPVGPVVHLYVVRGAAGVPSRVGVE